MTLNELKDYFHKELGAIHGKNEVDSFFRILSEYFLSFKSIEIPLNPNYLISDDIQKHFINAINRLIQEDPIQYILGEMGFYGLTFKVNPKVLIPRPETEELVQWILEENPTTNNQQITILDIGTGSGCIAITLAKYLPKAKVYALDVSPEALKVAKENANLNNVEVEFIEGDILTLKSLAKQFNDWDLEFNNLRFDIIVSNPPYVRKLEKSSIKGNVLRYEPHLALFVEDDDPLLFYQAICKFAVHNLKPKGMLYFEINQYLGAELKQLLTNFDFKSIELRKDLFGNDRMLKAKNHE